MKKALFILAVFITVNLSAQSEKYATAMGEALKQMTDAKQPDALVALAGRFERIGDAEKNQWLPYYYAAIIKTRMSMQHLGGEPDNVADEANSLITKATSIVKPNSELYCAMSMIASARLMVDPQNRWMEFGPQSNKWIEEAKKADSTNPRPYVLQAIALKNMPEQFGGGCERAKPIAQKAVSLFNTFKSAGDSYPNWGRDMVDGIIASCK